MDFVLAVFKVHNIKPGKMDIDALARGRHDDTARLIQVWPSKNGPVRSEITSMMLVSDVRVCVCVRA